MAAAPSGFTMRRQMHSAIQFACAPEGDRSLHYEATPMDVNAWYLAAKMRAAMRSLFAATAETRRAAVRAFALFEQAFPPDAPVPGWARQKVDAIRELAPFAALRRIGDDDPIVAWVGQMSNQELLEAFAALLDLYAAAERAADND